MSLTKRYAALAAIVIAVSSTGCTKHVEAAATPPALQILTKANRDKTHAVALALMAQDRANDAKHRAEMDRLIDADVVRSRDEDRAVSLLLRLHNKTAKTVKTIGAGLEVDDNRGKRLGLAEVDGAAIHIQPHGTVSLWLPVRHVRFGEDAGTVRMAACKRKRIRLSVPR